MSDAIFELALRRALDYCRQHGQRSLSLTFHGGEPCLVGAERLSRWCGLARERLAELHLTIAMQTNGVLIDQAFIEVFREHSVGVGVSIDGPAPVHDRVRLDHAGRGSHARVVQAVRALGDAGVKHGLLCVIPLGVAPLRVHRHLAGLGAPSVTYLLPDHTHETIADVRARFGPTPCADFLIEVFDDWWFNQTLAFQVRDLWNVARVILGGTSEIETIGNQPPHYFFVETDGSIEGLDALRVCENALAATHLTVQDNSFEDVRVAGGLHARAIFEGLPLPTACQGCAEAQTCAGGHLPHRYARASGFDNASAWCADLKKLFAHVRQRLKVAPAETSARRAALSAQAQRVLAAAGGQHVVEGSAHEQP